MHRVFVYGTLKRGLRNAHLLSGSRFVSAAEVPGFALYDLGDYPGIVPTGTSDDKVPGEIFEVTAETLAKLDRLEDEGTLYRRECLRIGNVDTFIYVYLPDVGLATRIATWPT